MGFATIILRYVCSTRFILLLTALITQPERPLGTRVTCESNHSQFPMTDMQTRLCKLYPEVVSFLMTDAVEVFQYHCYNQFKDERWDCTNVTLPIFGTTQPPFLSLQTKEAAFVYALASATVVHTIAQKCNENASILGFCGCDKSLKNEVLADDEKWAGCSPNIHFSINFAKKFVDRREDNTTLKHQTFVLHNNKIGRMAVMDYMYKTCTCVVPSATQCFYQKICKLKLPTMDEVAMKLKTKYEQSSYSMIMPSSGHQHVLVVEKESRQKVNPEKMIYFSHSPDYCTANPHYNIAGVAGRGCTLSDTSFHHHCNKLCCDHGFVTHKYRIVKPCGCRFEWCCRTECRICNRTVIKHRCKNKPEVSSTH